MPQTTRGPQVEDGRSATTPALGPSQARPPGSDSPAGYGAGGSGAAGALLQTPEAISQALDRVLPRVEKPARYTGGEWNSVPKPWADTPYRLALVFPDAYDLGMSNLGLMILYDQVNSQADMLAERAYLPWVDMLAEMKAHGIPLYGLETRHPLSDFDVIGFSLPYEQLYTNVLTTLSLSGIPILASQRGDDAPLVLAGGSACMNPEPMHAFFDAFFIGEGEGAILEILRCWTDSRRAGLSRRQALRSLARIRGIYVPSFYDVRYLEDGQVRDVRPLEGYAGDAAEVILKSMVPALPPPVTRFIVPFIDVVHDRPALEIQRGCTHGCRFCQAGMIFRPVRQRPLAEVLAAVDGIIDQTGYEELSLLSLSASDYDQIQQLVQGIVEKYGSRKLSINLPSLRIETFSVELMEALERGRRRSGFTLAPEAATDRLREVINKPIATESLLETVRQVFEHGWTTIKLYFMIGHPTQTNEDVEAIVTLANRVMQVGKGLHGRKAAVRVSVSTLVPKPHTPFQWLPMADDDVLLDQIAILERGLRRPGITLSWNDTRETLLEATLSRGDRRLSGVIRRAWELGAGFDAWGDQFKWSAWLQAFAESGLDPDWYARRARSTGEVLPWQHINPGVSRQFLAKEYENALNGIVEGDCRDACRVCGILGAFGDLRTREPSAQWGCPPPAGASARVAAAPGRVRDLGQPAPAGCEQEAG